LLFRKHGVKIAVIGNNTKAKLGSKVSLDDGNVDSALMAASVMLWIWRILMNCKSAVIAGGHVRDCGIAAERVVWLGHVAK
jgi:hypothetical protein